MRSQGSLEYLIILGTVLAISGALLLQSMEVYQQYKMFEQMVNSYYGTVYRVLIE